MSSQPVRKTLHIVNTARDRPVEYKKVTDFLRTWMREQFDNEEYFEHFGSSSWPVQPGNRFIVVLYHRTDKFTNWWYEGFEEGFRKNLNKIFRLRLQKDIRTDDGKFLSEIVMSKIDTHVQYDTFATAEETVHITPAVVEQYDRNCENGKY